MPAKVVYSDETEKPDGSRYEMVAWQFRRAKSSQG